MHIDDYLKTLSSLRKKRLLATAMEMGITISVISKEFRVLKLTWGKETKFIYNDRFHFNIKSSTTFARNKESTKLILQDQGVRVPLGITASDRAEALRRMAENGIDFPVVVKPIDATCGRAVRIGVSDERDLRRAINQVRAYWKKADRAPLRLFLVEKMVTGKDYRVLVLNDRVIACAQRIPALIEGDGRSTIQEIITFYNETRLPSYYLKVDSNLQQLLRRDRLSLSSVLERGRILQLSEVPNVSSGGKIFDKTREISSRFTGIALASVQALGLNFAGVDLMTPDISSDDPQQDYFVIEINGAPDYDIHEKPMITGKETDVTRILIEAYMGWQSHTSIQSIGEPVCLPTPGQQAVL